MAYGSLALRILSEFMHSRNERTVLDLVHQTNNVGKVASDKPILPIQDRDRETQGLRNPRQTQVSSGSGKVGFIFLKMLTIRKENPQILALYKVFLC